jgi:anti-sigma regulatory factor (Ser/Thr protein kinase)
VIGQTVVLHLPWGMFVQGQIQLIDSAQARALVRERLRDRSSDVIEIAELVTTELVNNAILHGGGNPILVIEVNDSHVRIEVSDAGDLSELEPLWGSPMRAGGRGLAIVDSLATKWGVDPCHDGKTVWIILNF